MHSFIWTVSAMTYVVIFLLVWIAFILASMLVIRWPKEAKEIRSSYSGKLLLKGFLFPSLLRSKLTNDHLLTFEKFRKRYVLYWLVILAAAIVISVFTFVQMRGEIAVFTDRMQEKYIED